MAEDVADGEQGAVGVEFEDIVEVAADLDRLARGEIPHRDIEVGRLRDRVRQHRPLQGERDLMLDGVQPLVLERAGHRLREVVEHQLVGRHVHAES